MSLLELFCAVDDFCKVIDEQQAGRFLPSGTQQRRRAGQLSDSEALTIMIHFHQSQYRNFKAYYQQHVQEYLQAEFPCLISYGRFVQRMPRLLGWLCLYLFSRLGACSGISFVDVTFIACVTIDGSSNTRYSKALPHAGKARQAGGSASNCTWWSMSVGNCWRST